MHEFPTQPWPVTLRQVMAHTAGLVSDGGDEGPLLAEHCERPAAALPHFADRALRFEPGTDYRYSNYGYIVVSAAVEAAAGEPFMRVMRKRVFEPLGMDDTGADAAAEQATSYFPRFGGDPRYGPDPMRDVHYSCYAGASAFVSTPSDLVRFGLAMSHGTLLRPATVQVLQSAQSLPSGNHTGYGLGWDLETVTLADGPATTIGHDGDLLGGQAVSLMTFPDRGLAVAVTTNMSYADTSGLAARLARVFAAAAKPPARQ
ncbi:MAG: beta-lactamase family protein [Acidobacteria bacterium]|nr:beta-lactamase family protein [Acidobacteriota bacterium]